MDHDPEPLGPVNSDINGNLVYLVGTQPCLVCEPSVFVIT